MPENVQQWWARRQRSKGVDIPYPVGTYRADWQRYPVLIRQYHPDLNGGVTLTQIPPAAEVLLQWQCEVGHLFVATPDEQRNRPGRERRRSTWCPACSEEAAPKRIRPAREAYPAPKSRARKPRPAPEIAIVGEAFTSIFAPKPASAAEADLRMRLAAELDLDFSLTAVRVAQPFFGRLKVWPDIILSELKVAIEYDTTGRHGLEHVGSKETSDRHKDRLLRSAGWEVIRVRCGKLLPLGPYDVTASGVTSTLVRQVIEQLRVIRGDLIVECYRRQSVTA